MILSSLFLEYTLEGGQNRPLFAGSRQKSGLKNKREIAAVLFGVPLQPGQVERTSIRNLSREQVQAARAQGKAYRLVGRIEQRTDGLRAQVRAELLERADPLVLADPASLIAHLELDVIPGLTLVLTIPPDADIPRTVAYDVLADCLCALPKQA